MGINWACCGRKDYCKMKKLVFLLEEQSMKEVLTILLPKIIPVNFTFQCIHHNGKSSLRKSIPIKTKGWCEPDVQFVIVHDKNSSDCKKLKEELYNLIDSTRHSNSLIRIACTELESWFLGDLDAIEKGYHVKLATHKTRALFRNPDAISNAKQELKKLVPVYQPISGSNAIAQFMDITKNNSHSFNVFVSGIKKLVQEAQDG
jgi:hypothetical protein